MYVQREYYIWYDVINDIYSCIGLRCSFLFFQAEDGIRDWSVTGVQTCALPICDRPIYGEDWFFSLGVISDTTFEARRIPTPIGAQSTKDARSDDMFGRGTQSLFNQNLIVSLSLIKGDTTFRPPDVELRFVPVINFNRTVVDEVRTLNIDPRRGTTRNDGIVAIQELFADIHLRNVSDNYDFDSLRLGIQPFTADFRGLLYIDQP